MHTPSNAAKTMPSGTEAAADGMVVLVTTVDDEAQAGNMARALLAQQLAACVQITRIESLYHWKGALQEHAEWQLSCKTTVAQAQALWQAVLDLHPYDVPMLYALPVARAHQPYVQWVAQTCDRHSDPGRQDVAPI